MIKITNATIKRDNFVIENINLQIKPNKITAIIGKNASGKSSLLHLLTGAIQSNLIKDSTIKTAHIDEHWPFPMNQTLLQIGELTKLVEPEFNNHQFEKHLLDFKIEPQDIYPELSTGNQKMSQVAFALARNLNLLLLDEILLNIDEYRKQHFKDILLDFMSKGKSSIVISTNQIDEIEDIVDDLIYLKDNQIIYQGSLLDLKTNFKTLKINHDELKNYDHIISTINHKHFVDICIQKKNDGSSNILDIINHLERVPNDKIHL